MERMADGKPFKMKGHTLPGINQRSEGNTDLPDGRSGSAAFQYRSPAKDYKKGYYGEGDSPLPLHEQAAKEGADPETVEKLRLQHLEKEDIEAGKQFAETEDLTPEELARVEKEIARRETNA